MSWTDLSGLVGNPPICPSPVEERAPPADAGETPDDGPAPRVETVATFVVGGTVLRAQIHQALRGTRFTVVGSESDGTALHLRRKGQRPSLAIVEAGDGSGDVAGLIGAIRQRSPGTRIVLAGDFGQPNWLQQPLARADGLVQGDACSEVLVASLDLVMLGAAVLPMALTGLLIQQARASAVPGCVQQIGFDDQRFVDLKIRQLSVLEKAVLCCLKKGAPNKTIARQVGLTVSAVHVAMKGILRKIGAQNRTQAALWALKNLPDDEGAPE